METIYELILVMEKREALQAQKEFEDVCSKVISIDDANAFDGLIREVLKDQFTALPEQLADQLEGIETEDEIRAILNNSFNSAMQKACESVEQEIPPELYGLVAALKKGLGIK